jgi:hypothetical protein
MIEDGNWNSKTIADLTMVWFEMFRSDQIRMMSPVYVATPAFAVLLRQGGSD